MTRRTLLIIGAAALALTACGGDDDAETDDDPPAATEAPAATDAPEEEPTAEAAAEAEDTPAATEAPPADTSPPATEAPVDAAPATTEPADEEPPRLVMNFVEIDGVQTATVIDMCFGAPGLELEVLSKVRGSDDGRAYAFVVADDASPGGAAVSEFNINDPANGVEWRSDGSDATDVVLEDKRIAATLTAASPDGATTTVTFDFTCPG